jgi:hypothetical protein
MDMPLGNLQSQAIPGQMMPGQSPPVASVALPVAPPGVLTINWHRDMTFDGHTAQFEDSVVAATPQQQLRTETMQVQLQRPVSFSTPNAQASPQVEEIRCLGGVAMESRDFDPQQQLMSYDRLQVADLCVNLISGALTAGGPGWISSVRRGTANPLGNPMMPMLGDNSPVPMQSQLTGLFVRFQRKIDGNLLRHQLTFHDQVKMAYAPVQDWNALLATDNPDQLGPDGVTVRCDQLWVGQMPSPIGGPPSVELEAHGNAVVEGTTFTARGNRIAYNEVKDMLILEGDGRNDAELFRQMQVGAAPEQTTARKITFWPKTKRVTVEDAKTLQIGQPPTNNKWK